MQTTLQALLAAKRPVVADGGMGTMLFAMGLERGAAPELWNVEQPDNVRLIHQQYIAAGAQVILTNTFGGSRFRLASHGLAERTSELNQAAAELARAAADAAETPVVVGGSVGPTGEMLEPLGSVTVEDATAAFADQVRGLVAGGVDVLWIETMADLAEVRAAVLGCRNAAPGMPIVATMTFDTRGRTMMGVTPEQALDALRELGVIALGGNCGNGPDEIEGVIEKMHTTHSEMPLVAKANAGLPRMEGDIAVYDATPEVMGDYARRVRALGATIVGACCGSSPEHIRAIAAALNDT